MRVETVVIGMFQSESHVVMDEASGAIAIIDTGDDASGIEAAVKRLGGKPAMILLTHGHIDHVGGLARLRRAYPEIPISMHAADQSWVDNLERQGRMFGIRVEKAPPIDRYLKEGDVIELGTGTRFHVLESPGHSPGGVIFYEPHAGAAFVGDTIFQGSIGRTDLPGGDAATLLRSLRTKILPLPDETVCYCGHGERTTVGRERRTNPFLQPDAERLLLEEA